MAAEAAPYFSEGGVTIYQGDCRAVLAQLPDASVNCCVTSPPYWGLRDYGVDSQVGLEATPSEYVAGMVDVFREVRRVLADDGTLWLNIGDSYQNGKGQARGVDPKQPARRHLRGARPNDKIIEGLKPKDLVGIPWMLGFALRADGWYLRQDIIWAKPAPMPESIKDRCTKAHEYIFLLSKSSRYHYDADAIAEVGQGAEVDKMPGGWATGDGEHSAVAHNTPNNHRKVNGGACFGKQRVDASGTGAQQREFDRPVYDKRNKRSVWTVASVGFPEAHFATFPPKLIEPCIRAGCPNGGTVLDPFFGAGTTGLVCQRQHVKCIGIELNPEYCEIAKQRLGQGVLDFNGATEVA